MVLSNTGTMYFIICGFVKPKGSALIYLFPSPKSDSRSEFPFNMYCLHIQAMPSAGTALTDHIMTCGSLHIKTLILHSIHRSR